MKYELFQGKIININIKDGKFEGKYVSVVYEYDEIENILYISHPRFANLYVPLEKGFKMQIRFYQGTMLSEYESKILDINYEDDPAIFKIKGPEKVVHDNKRSSLRIPVPNFNVNIKRLDYHNQEITGTMFDLSAGGMKLEILGKKIVVGEVFNMSFNLPIKKKYPLISVSAKVIWHKNIELRMFYGLKFLNLREKNETNLIDYTVYIQRNQNWESYVKKIVGNDY